MSKSSEAVKRWRDSNKGRMVAAMGGKCQCCGYNVCNNALAFHHIDPSKKDLTFGITRANPTSWEKFVIELRKCILVCHNCHSEIHAGIRNIPENYSIFDESYSDYKNIAEYDYCSCGAKKISSFRFCSQTCAAKNRRKVNWDSIDLIELLKNHTISELEEKLGISNAAIYKRRDKILNKI